MHSVTNHIFLRFTGSVKLKGIILAGEDDESHPAEMRLWVLFLPFRNTSGPDCGIALSQCSMYQLTLRFDMMLITHDSTRGVFIFCKTGHNRKCFAMSFYWTDSGRFVLFAFVWFIVNTPPALGKLKEHVANVLLCQWHLTHSSHGETRQLVTISYVLLHWHGTTCVYCHHVWFW